MNSLSLGPLVLSGERFAIIAGVVVFMIGSSILVNGILIVICILWLVPTFGVLVTSFRNSEDIFGSGWWTVFPHKEDVQSGEIKLDATVDVNGPITVEGSRLALVMPTNEELVIARDALSLVG